MNRFRVDPHRNSLEHAPVLVVVQADGNVSLAAPRQFQVSFRKSDGDEQQIQLDLGSWTYDGRRITLSKENDAESLDMSSFQDDPAGAWKWDKSLVIVSRIYYECCPEPFETYTVKLTMKRTTKKSWLSFF